MTAHLDDDRLSAVLDGDGSDADVEHAAECERCSEELARWAEVKRLLGESPAPATDSVRERAIEAALGVERPIPIAGRRPRSWLIARIAAAAAALAVVGGIVGLVAHNGGGQAHSTSSGAAVGTTQATRGTAHSGANAGSTGAVAASGASGAVSPLSAMSALVSSLRSQLENQQALNKAPVSPATATPACYSQAESLDSLRDGQLVRSESVTFQGVPAHAFVFQKGADHVVVVVRVSNCQELGRAGF